MKIDYNDFCMDDFLLKIEKISNKKSKSKKHDKAREHLERMEANDNSYDYTSKYLSDPRKLSRLLNKDVYIQGVEIILPEKITVSAK